eukprot:990767-Prymnesium_polylepis.1
MLLRIAPRQVVQLAVVRQKQAMISLLRRAVAQEGSNEVKESRGSGAAVVRRAAGSMFETCCRVRE